MTIIEKGTEAFSVIEELLGEYPDSTEYEGVTGIDCDEDDLEAQRQDGDDDPMAIIEVIAHWNPNTKEGILDWYFARESTVNDAEPNIEHGGPLLAFRYDSDEPDLDNLLEAAVPALNDSVEWAEFQLNDDEDEV
ncbi:hypothetical protein [Rubritalea tangerina]|uniref:Uncharacterized protein n=1 Tax=Rubritalea tangerina TaxID=430798 RepID=A0ABW4Z8K1_9BACT